MPELFDVLCVDIESGRVKWIEPGKTEDNAEAVMNMAIMRQGVEDRFFAVEPAGKFKVGDKL